VHKREHKEIKEMNYLEIAEKALNYLQESETDYARLKSEHQALKEAIKITESSLILTSELKTVSMKEHETKASPEYTDIIDRWKECLEQYELINAKRKRAELTIEMYRSVNSAMKRGNI